MRSEEFLVDFGLDEPAVTIHTSPKLYTIKVVDSGLVIDPGNRDNLQSTILVVRDKRRQ
jgi:hypothetical protein